MDSETDSAVDDDSFPSGWFGTVAPYLTPERIQDEYDAWKNDYIAYCDTDNSAYVRKDSNSTVSEGIAYGMLLAVNNDDRELFDKLSKFFHDHLDENGLMNWAMDGCAPPGDNDANAATDADLDAAMALLMAEKRWGGYLEDAVTLITNIKDHETEVCGALLVLKPGDAWGECSDTNPSYFAPGYYRAFAHYVPEQADHWLRMVEDTYTMIATNQSQMSGLLSDWCTNTGVPTGSYGYEACRTPWRFATDYAWTGEELPRGVLEGLHSAGAGQSGDDNSCFRGGYALTSIVEDEGAFDAAVETWLTETQYDNLYYQTTLRNLYILVASGNFPLGIAP